MKCSLLSISVNIFISDNKVHSYTTTRGQTGTKKTDYIETNTVVNFSLPQRIVTVQNTVLKTQNYYYYPSIHPSIIIIISFYFRYLAHIYIHMKHMNQTNKR